MVLLPPKPGIQHPLYLVLHKPRDQPRSTNSKQFFYLHAGKIAYACGATAFDVDFASSSGEEVIISMTANSAEALDCIARSALGERVNFEMRDDPSDHALQY
jgi:hypothetical protein